MKVQEPFRIRIPGMTGSPDTDKSNLTIRPIATIKPTEIST